MLLHESETLSLTKSKPITTGGFEHYSDSQSIRVLHKFFPLSDFYHTH